ncbi:MAG: tetratricopeptide repeat protein [Flavobacteriaceae bacterium]|nr:tetratricopeptide repeat protein [Flavobacteriaceae bacterium]
MSLKKNTNSFARKIIIRFITLVFLLFSLNTFAQDSINPQFKEAVGKAFSLRPTKYNTIESLFYKYKKDSTLMKYFAKESNRLKYLEGESYALNSLGSIYRNISFYSKALENHKQAERLAEIANNLELKVISLNMQGVVYRRMDFIRSALDFHTKALNIANAIKLPSDNIKLSIAVSQNSIGNIYLALKQYDLALVQFNKSLVIEKSLNNKLGLAINYQNIGYAKEAKGLLEEALKYYKTSLNYNNEINSEVGRVICNNSIGKIYIKQKKYTIALEVLKSNLEKALQTGDQFHIVDSYVNLGWVLSELNNLNKAEYNLNIAKNISKKYNFRSSEIEAYKLLSELNIKKGNHQAALQQFKLANELEKVINNERNLNYINDLVIKYESDNKSNTIKALSDENELVRTRLEKNQLALLFGLLGIILVSIIFTVYDRHKQLNQEKKILTLEQDMLRSQMNPHFIFNSLNSIKLYIINNEKENAVYYLNKFAKLIRKILVASTEKEVPLSDELETMELYMNIENIRFSNAIDFKILIDNNINTHNIKVPSLIIQPFLENALWHGLSSKEEDKKIVLKVEKNRKKHITISITDNGVGRKTSKEINKQKTLKRKSVGIALTKERLENFSKRYTNMYNIKIEDLHDEQGNALGTKVILYIPIHLVSQKDV